MDTFLKLIDRIIALLKVREERKAKIFKEIVQPLYEEFEKAAVQYFTFFRSTIKEISDDHLDDIVDKLKLQRNDYIQARIKIVTMSEVINEELGNTDILGFCDAMKDFFFVDEKNQIQPRKLSIRDNPQMQRLMECAQQMNQQNSRGSKLLDLLEEYLEEQDFDKGSDLSLQHIVLYVENGLKSMEEAWASASKKYAKLRINYLLSKRI